MAGELIFGSFTIADPANGDVYSRATAGQVQSLVTADIAFANTAGREVRIAGNQNTPETSFTIGYGPYNGRPALIYKSSVANMESFLFATSSSIRALMTSNSPIQTLQDRDGSYTGMRLMRFEVLSPITLVNHLGTDKYCIQWSAIFSRYTVS